MPVYRLGTTLGFPPPEVAEPSGLLAVGGDLSPERLLLAYANGIFPWFTARDPILWYSPDPRLVLVPRELHVSRSLHKQLRRGHFEVRFDTAFEQVIRYCASVPRRGEKGTWITPAMIEAYLALHKRGVAHCAEAWQGGALVGGVYGVALGGCFSAESMFSLQPDASKVALVSLVRRLEACDFDLFDAQVPSAHLARLGATEWPRKRFLEAASGFSEAVKFAEDSPVADEYFPYVVKE